MSIKYTNAMFSTKISSTYHNTKSNIIQFQINNKVKYS